MLGCSAPGAGPGVRGAAGSGTGDEVTERGDDAGEPREDDEVAGLIRALAEVDVGDARSIERAVSAAEALGEADPARAIPPLIRAIEKPMPKLSPGQRVRLAAISALGKFRDERAVDALIAVLRADPAREPVQLFGAAALALGETRSEKAIEPLLAALFRLPILYNQCRLALIAIGKPVIPVLLDVFNGQHAAINALAAKYRFNVNCDANMGPASQCQAPSNLQFKAASLLGDLYAAEATATLVDGLEQAPRPAFFMHDAPGPSQHNAILDALRRIADPSVAGAVIAYGSREDTDAFMRPVAIDVYSQLATDTSALPDLARLMRDDTQDSSVRLAAGIAYGRLVNSRDQLAPLTRAIAQARRLAVGSRNKLAAAQKAFAAAEKAYQRARERADKAGRDERLTAAAAQAKLARDRRGEAKHEAESSMQAHRGWQRALEQHVARAHIGITCRQDPACYIGVLDQSPDAIGEAVAKHVGRRVKDSGDWSEADVDNLKDAAVDRALIELIKMKARARPALDRVLDRVDSTHRITRQGLLLVMVHSAPLPCDQCVRRLDEIIAQPRDDPTVAALTSETKAVRNYFLWAGR